MCHMVSFTYYKDVVPNNVGRQTDKWSQGEMMTARAEAVAKGMERRASGLRDTVEIESIRPNDLLGVGGEGEVETQDSCHSSHPL